MFTRHTRYFNFDFNPRSREGSDVLQSHKRGCYKTISIHAPARGATYEHVDISEDIEDFNPRSREGSDAGLRTFHVTPAQFQSTLPRGERQCLHVTQGFLISISIHAPARGATSAKRAITAGRLFQSTLPRGERRTRSKSMSCHGHFNPRSREGSDNMCKMVLYDVFNFNPRSREGSDNILQYAQHSKKISIHAPARGAT